MKRVKHSVKYIQNFRKAYQVVHENKTFKILCWAYSKLQLHTCVKKLKTWQTVWR